MRGESSKSRRDRLGREAEEDIQAREDQMSREDPEGKMSEFTINKEVNSGVGGEQENNDEERGKGKKRRRTSDMHLSERYNEDDADITIISSDGVAFKVHSLLLTRASPVFKNMLGIAQSNSQRDTIDLTDSFVELSVVIWTVLDIPYDQEVISFHDDKLYHHVIEFARKYDMSIILKTISKEIRVHATSPDKGHDVLGLFRIAIDLGDYELIAAIVRAKGSHAWPLLAKKDQESELNALFPSSNLTLPKPLITGSTKEYVPGAKAFDLGGWPYSTFAALPTPLAWAILRAHHTDKKPFLSDGIESIGKELQKVLESMYPRPFNNDHAEEEGGVALPTRGFLFGRPAGASLFSPGNSTVLPPFPFSSSGNNAGALSG